MLAVRSSFALVIVLVVVAVAPAAVVAVLNASDAEIACTLEHKDAKPVAVKLAAGEVKALPVGRESVLRTTINGKAAAFKLDPYTPYLFVRTRESGLTFSGVELAGELPPPDDVADPKESKPLTIAVTLYGDAADPRAKDVWQKELRDRFTAAAKVIEAQTAVVFQLAGIDEWKQTADVADIATALVAFETQVKPDAGSLAVGFLNRKAPGDSYGDARDPGHPHLIVREALPKTESEKVEALVQYLARFLGAARTADPSSVMRVKLADGQAGRTGFRVQLDPINLIAVSVWAEERQAGRGPKFDKLSAKARQRLLVLYKTLIVFQEQLKSEDGHAQGLVDQLLALNAAEPTAKPVPKPVEKGDAKTEAIRTVVNAVTAKASELSRQGEQRPKGDALTAEYVKAAAGAASGCGEKVRGAAFLLGLGLTLDDSNALRGNPLAKALAEAVETDAERKERLPLLGTPTLRGRRDLCQHFAVSAALVELIGADKAELIGLAKEVADMRGASGFSFADLAVDFAGIEFARNIQKDPSRLEALAKQFAIDDHLPVIKELKEGLTADALTKEFGGPTDARFTAQVADLKKAVKALKAYKE